MLALASSFFEGMFSTPQPPNQVHNGNAGIPIVDVTESQETMDVLLRLLYPVVERPRIVDSDPSSLVALFEVADKYDIPSLSHTLEEALRAFLKYDPSSVYLVACRFGLLEVAREGVLLSTPRSYSWNDEVLLYISRTELRRFTCFVHKREDLGRTIIRNTHGWAPLGREHICPLSPGHWMEARKFYIKLATAIEEKYARNPHLGLDELLGLSRQLGGLPPGCVPHGNPVSCPLREEFVTSSLADLLQLLAVVGHDLEMAILEDSIGSG